MLTAALAFAGAAMIINVLPGLDTLRNYIRNGSN